MSRFRTMALSPDNWAALLLGFLMLTGFGYLALISVSFYGGADEIVHYWMARYSWEHPKLLLDLWGKPLYTTLASPFAQFGFTATALFNVLIAGLTAYYSYRILKILQVRFAWTIIPLLVSSPVYFIMIPSVMTELLFGLILVLFIFLYLKGSVDLASILVAFLPFARNEGLFLLPVIGAFYILVRYYRGLALLLTGVVIMSLTGWVVFGDVLWLLHRNPYAGDNAYGSGSLLHFVEATKLTTGLIPGFMASVGWVVLTVSAFRQRGKVDWLSVTFLYLTSVIFLAYLAMHSFVWYKGTGGSLGLIRVMAAVYPLVALGAAFALNSLVSILRKPLLITIVHVAVLVPAVIFPFTVFDPPVEEDEIQSLGRAAAQFIGEHYPDTTRITCLDPRIVFYLEKDPFDERLVVRGFNTTNELDEGNVLIWDAHFMGFERWISKGSMLADSSLIFIRKFAPADTIMIFGNVPYEIIVFEKNPVPTHEQN